MLRVMEYVNWQSNLDEGVEGSTLSTQCILPGDRDKAHTLDRALARAQYDERSVRRKVWFLAKLSATGVAGLWLFAFVGSTFEVLPFWLGLISKGFLFLAFGALAALSGGLVFWASSHARVVSQRNQCHEFVFRTLEASLPKAPVETASRSSHSPNLTTTLA